MVIETKQDATRPKLGVVGLVATLVLALATGLPLQSAKNFLPHSGEQAGPYLGV